MASSSAIVQKDYPFHYGAFASTIKPYNTMKINKQLRRGFTLVELLVVIVIIASLAGLTAPMVIKQRKKADQTEAVNNAKQIGLALFEFETEYGSFPDDTTALAVATATTTTAVSGTSSNDRFLQLIRAGVTQSEAMFYAKSTYTKKPDGVTTGDKALDKGEVGFGIIMMGTAGMTASGNPSRPIIAAPFTSALADKFDPDLFDGKAVVLKVDNSVTSLSINTTSGLVTLNGSPMLTTGLDSVWGVTATVPTWAYPEAK
jgi:prepilin-type N-terminal cleavage/methylation domain-containing protein